MGNKSSGGVVKSVWDKPSPNTLLQRTLEFASNLLTFCSIFVVSHSEEFLIYFKLPHIVNCLFPAESSLSSRCPIVPL